MEQSSSRNRSLLEVAFNNQCKFNNQKKADVAKAFCMSYPTLYRKLLPDSELQADFIKRLSEFLDKSEEEILSLHRSFENEENTDEINQNNDLLKPYGYASVVSVVFIIFLILMYYLFLLKPDSTQIKQIQTYHAEYAGSGIDIDLSSPIKLEDFHSDLYKYKFIDVQVALNGEEITLTCDILITELATPENQFLGNLHASGVNISGKAALSYKITNNLNQETWVGVFMLDLPLSGGAMGYWLTIHNDNDPKSTGKFALGDVHLNRNQNEISRK